MEPLGVEILKSRGFFTEAYWYWLAVAALFGFTLLYNLLYILALAFLNRMHYYLFEFCGFSEFNDYVLIF